MYAPCVDSGYVASVVCAFVCVDSGAQGESMDHVDQPLMAGEGWRALPPRL
jgi:hypothetical protein